MQALEVDPDDDTLARFRANAIVKFLMNFAWGKGVGLSELRDMPWSQEDWDQFCQLIGYSLDGYHEMSFLSDEAKVRADVEYRRLTKKHLPACGSRLGGCVKGCWNYDPDGS